MTAERWKGNVFTIPPPPFGSTAPIWALAYLHDTLCFTSVLQILDSR
jgi:hypothetical protein